MVTNSLVSTKRFEALSPPPPLMPQLASPLALQGLASIVSELKNELQEVVRALKVRDSQSLATRPATTGPIRARRVESREVQAQPAPSSPPAADPAIKVSRSRFLSMFD